MVSLIKEWRNAFYAQQRECPWPGPRPIDTSTAAGFVDRQADVDALLASDVDSVAIMTQRWSHGELALKALEAGKNVYSAVPMAISAEEIAAIVAKVEETGLIYMMGETSYYNPAVIYARARIADGAFGRVFYSEGDYVHDMDLGFYAAYQYSGGEDWKKTASYPPMMYPTHSVGGVLGAWLYRHFGYDALLAPALLTGGTGVGYVLYRQWQRTKTPAA